MPRSSAQAVVYDAAQAAFVENRSFSALLAAAPRVTAHLGPEAIERPLDPAA